MSRTQRSADVEKSDGAFFTSPLTAMMLASLTYTRDWIDYADYDRVSRLRIMDPACGDGELLIASYEVIKQRIRDAGGRVPPRLIECFEGLDIHATSIERAKERGLVNVACVPHGRQPDGSWRAGALDLLLHDEFHQDDTPPFDELVRLLRGPLPIPRPGKQTELGL